MRHAKTAVPQRAVVFVCEAREADKRGNYISGRAVRGGYEHSRGGDAAIEFILIPSVDARKHDQLGGNYEKIRRWCICRCNHHVIVDCLCAAKPCGRLRSCIAKYCSNVTPGAHRIVACLISYEDKISPRCRMTAYLGSDDLGVRMKALKAMATSCSADILQYCSSVSAGGGRIYDCLMKNKATLTDDCRNQIPTAQQFMKD